MLAALLSLLMLADLPAADLGGRVVGPDKQPIVGATVYVLSAAPRKGTPTQSEFDYPECGKSAISDAAGAFKIAGVDDSLTYRMIVVADGFRPLALKKVDPARGEVTASLKPTPADLEPAKTIKGHIVDSTGAAVIGARIEPYGARDGTQRWWGGTSEVSEAETYTDAKGEFLLILKKPDVQIDIKLFAPHAAPSLQPLLSPGESVQEFTTAPGASITGRLVKDGAPLAGINMRLTQQDRGVEHYIGDFDAITDADGKFTFKHLPSGDQFNVYGTMKTLAEHGAMELKPIRSGDDGTTDDAGEFTVAAGHTVSGTAFCSDDKPLPTGAKAHFSRWNASDDVEIPVGADGKFEFKNVPTDLCEFWVRVNGYHVSPDNESFEPANAQFLLGRVDDDITDLRVKLDPGPNERNNYNSNKWNTLENSQMKGVPKE